MIIIFDCDGVLHSASREGLYEAYKKLIEAHGKKYTDYFTDLESFMLWWHPDWHRNNERLGVVAVETDIDKIFHEVYDKYIFLFKWVPDISYQLSLKHLLVVLTSSAESSARKFLKSADRYFEFIIGCEKVKKLKPDPDGVLRIMRNFPEVSENDFIMIGDMGIDIQAGKSARIKTGAVSWGLGKKEELLAFHPDMFFDTPEDLLKIGKINS